MYNKKQIKSMYKDFNGNEIDNNILEIIIPKLYLILNKTELDEIEMLTIIDDLIEINNLGLLNNINVEIINIINKISSDDILNLSGTLYFSQTLKNILIPHDKNICDKEYNLTMFLSEFELLLDLISKKLNKKELVVLDKYNHELTEIIKKYREVKAIYKQIVYNDVMLDSMISHFATMLYFKLDEYDYDYNLIMEVFERIVNKYQEFIDYCCSLGIHKNYTRIEKDIDNIKLEYIIGNDMIKYVHDEKKEKIKRK